MEEEIYKTTVSIKSETAKKLKIIANKEDRSLASLIRKVLSDYAEKYELEEITEDNVVTVKKPQKLPPLLNAAAKK